MKFHEVKLNVSDVETLKPEIAFKQFSYGSDAVRVMLYDGADAYDPQVDFDACVCRVIRPDRELDEKFLWRKGDEAIGVLPSNDEGVKYIDVPVTLMMSFVAGKVAIELSFIKFTDGEITARKTLARIVISVFSSISSYNVIEKKQIDMLTHILSVAESLKVSCNVDEYVRFIEDAISAEVERVNNEALRVEAENLRSQEENERAIAEALRASAEGVRCDNEALRGEAEELRSKSENARAKAEEQRVINEERRFYTDLEYLNSETERCGNEENRVSAEKLRVAAELDRQAAEDARIAYINSVIASKLAELVGSAPESLDTLSELSKALGDDPNFATTVSTLIGQKVEKVEGKGLSANDYTNLEKYKLSNIEDGAEVNVKSDWMCEDASSDAYIKNKPEMPSVEGLASEGYVDERLGDIAEQSKDYTDNLAYYGAPNIKPTDESLFYFTLDDETMTARVEPHHEHYGEISGDLVIPHHYTVGNKTYTVTSCGGFNTVFVGFITSVTIPNTITEILEQAFADHESLATVKIPDSVEVIEWDAFINCFNLTEITLPKNLKIIGSSAFDTTGLKEIVIPDGVTTIGECAFSATGLKEIVIPNGVTTIGRGAFSYCEDLESIVIPVSVTSIGNCIFQECNEDAWITVYYNGTEEQWDVIEKSDDVFGHDMVQVVFLGAATKKYVDEKLEGKAEKATKINGKSLSGDIDLTADDVGALPSNKIVEGFGVPFDVSSTNLVTINKVHPKEHDVEVKLESKNLISPSVFSDYELQEDGSYYAPHAKATKRYSFELPAGTYTLSYQIKSALNYGYRIALIDENGTLYEKYVINTDDFQQSVFTFSNTAKITTVLMNWGSASEGVYFKDLQIEKGSIATPYTPYVDAFADVESVTVCGKNLIPFPHTQTSKTENGITFTVNDDGSVLVNGTATKNTQFYISTSGFEIPKTGTYCYSGCPNGGKSTTYNLYVSKSDSNGWIAEKYDTGNGNTWLYEEGYSYKFLIYVWKDTVCENLLFKPMLEVGSVATEYETYKGGTYPVTDGKATVKSVSPTMNITTPTRGVNVEAKGYQDGLSVIDELKQAILSLGGNI